MDGIAIEDVTKSFSGGVVAVDNVSLSIEDGEFMVLVGPSGCGKTTLLRMIAGLESPSSGAIRIGGVDVTNARARERDVAMVFQNYALYPHMSVRENLSFCLRMQKMGKAAAADRVAQTAKLLGLEAMLDRKPSALSGGQRQRVAMGRAIVREPKAFLMDEPLSNLDAKLRVAMRTELSRLHDRLATTTVYVTHDQVEAMTLGQRVAVLHDGQLLQVDRPQSIYAKPRNLFVAAFIGSPSMNLVEATLTEDAVEFGGFSIRLGRSSVAALGMPRVILGIRPESFEDAAYANPSLPRMDVVVEVLEELGSDTYLVFDVAARQAEAALIRAATEEEASLFEGEQTSVFNARVDPRSTARAGDKVTLSVDPRTFHFFDPDSQERLEWNPEDHPLD